MTKQRAEQLKIQPITFWHMVAKERICPHQDYFTVSHWRALRRPNYWSFYVELADLEMHSCYTFADYLRYKLFEDGENRWQITDILCDGFVENYIVYNGRITLNNRGRIWEEDGKIQIIEKKIEEKSVIVGLLIHISKPSTVTLINDWVVKTFFR